MKNRITSGLIAILCLFLFVVTTSAVAVPTIKVGSAEALPGETVIVDVTMQNNPGINTFTFGFEYDTSKLTLESVALSANLGGQLIYGKKAVWFNNNDTTYTGKILSLTFKVAANASKGDVAVNIIYGNGDISNYNEEDVDFTVVPGKITVKKPVCNHTGGSATCENKAVCRLCGEAYGSLAAHKYENAVTKATLTKSGKIENKCTVCGDVKSTTTVYYPKTIKLSATSYSYDGKVKTPTVTVKDSKGNTLKKDTDYTVKYESGRKYPGTYTVAIYFKGNYSDVKRITFTIAPKATSKIVASQSTTAIKLTWKAVTGADGYIVYKYNAKTKKYESIKTLTGTSYTLKKLKAGTAYKFRVKAYTKDDGTIYGPASAEFATATKPATPTLKVSSTTKGKANLAWSNVAGETGYQVYFSAKKSSGYKKLGTYKANVVKASRSKLTRGKTYYFKVRAYTKTASGNVYGAWSSVKSVKIK